MSAPHSMEVGKGEGGRLAAVIEKECACSTIFNIHAPILKSPGVLYALFLFLNLLDNQLKEQVKIPGTKKINMFLVLFSFLFLHVRAKASFSPIAATREVAGKGGEEEEERRRSRKQYRKY